MKYSYLISIGYSIGIIPYNKDIVAIIDRGDDSIITEVKNFGIWQLIFECVDENSYFTKYNKIYNDNNAESILNDLVSSGVVLKIDISDEFEKQYDMLKSYKLFRQGLGVGVDKDNINKYIILTNEENKLDPVEFTVWSNANMNSTIEDIYKSFEERINKQALVSILLTLYHSNLIYFMR